MNIIINDELLKYIDPLTPNEYAALERSLLAEGCRDALVLWGEVLVDGHNRYEICRKYDIEFRTVQNTSFSSLDDVLLWMIDNQLGRRSVSDFQRGILALRKRDIMSTRSRPAKTDDPSAEHPEAAEAGDAAAGDAPVEEAAAEAGAAQIKTREDIARVAGISSNTIGQIERIRKTAAPELMQAVRAGTISINAAAAVASLPSEEQVSAVAGGKKELRQAAKHVREQKNLTRTPRAATAGSPAASTDGGVSAPVGDDPAALRAEIARLQARIAELTSENHKLKAQLNGEDPSPF
ncbi:hypothetical protein PQR62_14215 [Herbaspirillum lusitanum]|uniref:Plasmid replication/partition related protein n=1 Tax=Herbaspirillum lusitanum TaxID=213312 RepID=A0ABW9AB26_9BURK